MRRQHIRLEKEEGEGGGGGGSNGGGSEGGLEMRKERRDEREEEAKDNKEEVEEEEKGRGRTDVVERESGGRQKEKGRGEKYKGKYIKGEKEVEEVEDGGVEEGGPTAVMALSVPMTARHFIARASWETDANALRLSTFAYCESGGCFCCAIRDYRRK